MNFFASFPMVLSKSTLVSEVQLLLNFISEFSPLLLFLVLQLQRTATHRYNLVVLACETRLAVGG